MGRFIIPDSEHGNIMEEADTKESEDVNDAVDACDFKAAGDKDTHAMKSTQPRKKSMKSIRKIDIRGGDELMRKEVVSMKWEHLLPPCIYLFILSL